MKSSLASKSVGYWNCPKETEVNDNCSPGAMCVSENGIKCLIWGKFQTFFTIWKDEQAFWYLAKYRYSCAKYKQLQWPCTICLQTVILWNCHWCINCTIQCQLKIFVELLQGYWVRQLFTKGFKQGLRSNNIMENQDYRILPSNCLWSTDHATADPQIKFHNMLDSYCVQSFKTH